MRAVAFSNSNMSNLIIQYYFNKAQIREKPEQILTDSVLMSVIMDGMSPGLLASYPEFVRMPTHHDEHVRNYKVITSILQSYGADTNNFTQSVDGAVQCLVVALLLNHVTNTGNSGLTGLIDFMSEVVSNYNITFDGSFSNDNTSRVLYYAYAYLSDSPNDVEGFKRGLIKDGIPVLFDQEIDDEERNMYQVAYIYNLVYSYGRPMFRVRQMADKIIAQQKGDQLEAQVLDFQHQCAEANTFAIKTFENCSKIDSLATKETISATIQQLIIQSKEDQINFLTQIEHLVQDDIDIKLLKEQGYKPKEKEFNIKIDHFVESFSDTFAGARDVLYHIFDVCAKMQSFDMLQDVVIYIEQEINKKLRLSLVNLVKSQSSLNDSFTFIQNFHQVFVDHRNVLLHAYISQFLQIAKQYINEHMLQQFDITNAEVPQLNIKELLKQFAAYVTKLSNDETHQFLVEYLSLQFEELSNILNSKINVEDKQMLILQINDNIKYYQEILNQLKDEYTLQEKLNVIKELVNDPDMTNSNETPIRIQYKKLALECYTTIIQLFQKATQQVFAHDPRESVYDEGRQFTVSDYKLQLSNILGSSATQKIITFNYQELNQLLSKQTHFDYLIGGLQALKLQHYHKIDLSYAKQLMHQLAQLDEQIKKNHETQFDGQLSLAHFQTVYDIIDQINVIQERNRDSAKTYIQNSSDFLETMVQCIQAQIADLTLMNDEFEKIKTEVGDVMNGQFQLSTQTNLSMIFKAIHDVYYHLKNIQQRLYNPNAFPSSEYAPQIQKRFGQLIQMIICDVFQSGINAKISLSLFGLIQKLFLQYNDLVCSVQRQIDDMQIILGVVEEFQRVYQVIKGPLVMLSNATNGWILYKGALSCPVQVTKPQNIMTTSEIKDLPEFLASVFNENIVLDDIALQIDNRSITFWPYDKAQIQQQVNERLSQSAAVKTLLESALYCFNSLNMQLQGNFSEYVSNIIQGYKKEIEDVIFRFQNVYEESLLLEHNVQHIQAQVQQSNMQTEISTSSFIDKAHSRLMTINDVISRTYKPIDPLTAESADTAAQAIKQCLNNIMNSLKSLESQQNPENAQTSSLINLFKVSYTSYLLQYLQSESNMLLQQCKLCGLDPRLTGLSREVYDEIVDAVSAVDKLFEQQKQHSDYQISLDEQYLEEMNRIPYIFNVLVSGRQQHIEQSEFNDFLPTVIKLQSQSNSKARPSILLSQQIESMTSTQKYKSLSQKGKPSQQLLYILQNLCRSLSEIKLLIETNEANPEQISNFAITVDLLAYIQPYVEFLSCYESDQEIYNIILKFSNHYRGDLSLLKRQGKTLKEKVDQKVLRNIKQVLDQFDKFQELKTTCEQKLSSQESLSQTKELLRLNAIKAKVDAKVRTFILNEEEIQAIIKTVINGPEQQRILAQNQDLIADPVGESLDNNGSYGNSKLLTYYDFIQDRNDDEHPLIIFSQIKRLEVYMDQFNDLNKYIDQQIKEVKRSFLYNESAQSYQGNAQQIVKALEKSKKALNNQKLLIRQLAGQIHKSVAICRFSQEYDHAVKSAVESLINVDIQQDMSYNQLTQSIRDVSQVQQNAEKEIQSDRQALRVKANYSAGTLQIPELLISLLYKIKKLQLEKEKDYLTTQNVQQILEKLSVIKTDLDSFVQSTQLQNNSQEILNFLLKLNKAISDSAKDVQKIGTLLQSYKQQQDVTNCDKIITQFTTQLSEFAAKCDSQDSLPRFVIQTINNTALASQRLQFMVQSKIQLLEGWNEAQKIKTIGQADQFDEITDIAEGDELHNIVKEIQSINSETDRIYKGDIQRNQEVLSKSVDIREKHKEVLNVVESHKIQLEVDEMKEFIKDTLHNYFDVLQSNSTSSQEVLEKLIAIQVTVLKKAHLFRNKINELLHQYISVVQKEGIKYQLFFNIDSVTQIASTIKDSIEAANNFLIQMKVINTNVTELENIERAFYLENQFAELFISELKDKSISLFGEVFNQIRKDMYQHEIKITGEQIYELKGSYDALVQNIKNKINILKIKAEKYFQSDYISVDLIINKIQKTLESDFENNALFELEQSDFSPSKGIDEITQQCKKILYNQDQYTVLYNALTYRNGQLLKESTGQNVQHFKYDLEVYRHVINQLTEIAAPQQIVQFYKDVEQLTSNIIQSALSQEDKAQESNFAQNHDDISTLMDNQIETNEEYQTTYLEVQAKVTKMQRYMDQTITQIHKSLQNPDLEMNAFRDQQLQVHQFILNQANYCLINCVELIRYAKSNGREYEQDSIQNIVKQVIYICQDSKQIENTIIGFALQKRLQSVTSDYLEMINNMTREQIDKCKQYATVLQTEVQTEEQQQQQLHLLRLSLISLQTCKEQLMQFTLLRKQIYGTLSLDNDFSQYQNPHTSDLRNTYSAFIKHYLPDQAMSKVPMYALVQHTHNDINMVIQTESQLSNLCQIQSQVASDCCIREPVVQITEEIKENITTWLKSLNYAMRQVIDTQGDMSMNVLFKSFYIQQIQLASIVDKYCSDDQQYKELYDLLKVCHKNMDTIKHVHADVLSRQQFSPELIAQFYNVQLSPTIDHTYQKKDLVVSLQQLNSELLSEIQQLLLKTLPAIACIQAQGGHRQKLCMNQFIEQQICVLQQAKGSLDQLNNSLSISQETQEGLPHTLQFVHPAQNPFILQVYSKSIETAILHALKTQTLDLNNTIAQYKNFEYAAINNDVKACKNALFLLLNDAIQLSAFPQLLGNRSNLEANEYGFDKYEWKYYDDLTGSTVIQYKNVQQLVADINKMTNQLVYIQNQEIINKARATSFEGYMNRDQVIIKHITKQVREFCNDVKVSTARCKQWELLQHLKLQPALHSLALRGQILSNIIYEMASILKLNGEMAILPETFGFFNQKCLYQILGENKFKSVVLSLKLLSPDAANNVKTEVVELLTSFHEAIRILKQQNELNGYNTLEEILHCTIKQNQYIANYVAHQQIQVLLSTSYFINQPTLYRNLVNVATEVSRYENNEDIDSFRLALLKYYDNYLSQNMLGTQDQSIRWEQVLSQKYISETLINILEKINPDIQVPSESDYRYFTIPVVMQGEGSKMGQHLVKERTTIATYEHMDTIGPLIKKFCTTGCRFFKLDPEIERLSTLSYKPFLDEMQRLSIQEQNVCLYELEDLKAAYQQWQNSTTTVEQKIAEVQKRVSEQHKTNSGKYKQQTFASKMQLHNFLSVYRHTKATAFIQAYAQPYINIQYYDQQLNTTLAKYDRLLARARPLQNVIKLELDLIENILLTVGQNEAVQLTQLSDTIYNLFKLFTPINQHLTNIEATYEIDDFRLVRVITQVWHSLGLPKLSQESMKRILNIAGETDLQSWALGAAGNEENVVKAVCTYIQQESLQFVDVNDDADEQVLQCQVVLGPKYNETFIE